MGKRKILIIFMRLFFLSSVSPLLGYNGTSLHPQRGQDNCSKIGPNPNDWFGFISFSCKITDNHPLFGMK